MSVIGGYVLAFVCPLQHLFLNLPGDWSLEGGASLNQTVVVSLTNNPHIFHDHRYLKTIRSEDDQ